MPDVTVFGPGNAALPAAVSAGEAGASVPLLERGPREAIGGNGFFTGGAFRFSYNGIEDIRGLIDLSEAEVAAVDVGSYTAAKFHDDIARVTEDLGDPDLSDR